MFKSFAFAAAAVAIAAPVLPVAAQEAPISGRTLTIYGDDKCPRDTICVRAPESDRYRIPERLRRTENTPARESWADRAASVDRVGATGVGSCSTTQPGGQSGCVLADIRRAKAERQQEGEAVNSGLLEYLPTID